MNSKNYYDDNNTYSQKLIRGKVTATEGVHNFANMKLSYGSIGANRIDVLRALQKESKFRIVWYVVFSVLACVCLGLDFRNWQAWFNVADLIILMINIDLVSRGKIVGIYIGLIECFMYIYICYASGLYGEIIKMCALNIPLNIFSIISWTKSLKEQKKKKYESDSEKDNTVTIKKLKPKSYIWISLAMVVLYVGFFFGLKAINTNALIFSTAVLTLTVFAKILSGLRYKENYLFSLVAGILSTLMWVEVIIASAKTGSFDYSILLMVLNSLAIVTNDIQGYSIWKAMYRKIAINGGEVFAMRKLNIKRIVTLRHQYQKLHWDEKIDTEKNS